MINPENFGKQIEGSELRACKNKLLFQKPFQSPQIRGNKPGSVLWAIFIQSEFWSRIFWKSLVELRPPASKYHLDQRCRKIEDFGGFSTPSVRALSSKRPQKMQKLRLSQNSLSPIFINKLLKLSSQQLALPLSHNCVSPASENNINIFLFFTKDFRAPMGEPRKWGL